MPDTFPGSFMKIQRHAETLLPAIRTKFAVCERQLGNNNRQALNAPHWKTQCEFNVSSWRPIERTRRLVKETVARGNTALLLSTFVDIPESDNFSKVSAEESAKSCIRSLTAALGSNALRLHWAARSCGRNIASCSVRYWSTVVIVIDDYTTCTIKLLL